MEGLIPFVYKALVQYKNGREGHVATWFNDSTSASYMRLPTGDSGRFQTSDKQMFQSDYADFSTSSPISSSSITTTSSSPVHRRFTSRRVVSKSFINQKH